MTWAARFYADEDVPLPTVVALRDRGHDILTAYEAGRANQSLPDETVLADACAQGRILLTQNRRHFQKLSQRQPSHPGIVAITPDPDAAGQAERIERALKATLELYGKMEGQFVRVNRPSL